MPRLCSTLPLSLLIAWSASAVRTGAEPALGGVAGPASSAICADGSAEQSFDSWMVGCAGTVNFSNRAVLCVAGTHVCSAAEWVAHRGGAVPIYDYWTNDNLMYNLVPSCWVSPTSGMACPLPFGPMLVCTPSGIDAAGNKCSTANCGYLAPSSPNEYFGGCAASGTAGYATAGALCCPEPGRNSLLVAGVLSVFGLAGWRRARLARTGRARN
jgi:hypothetical protein